MTKLSELISIPEQVHKADFVISLATAIGEPERTVHMMKTGPSSRRSPGRIVSGRRRGTRRWSW